MGMTDRKKVIKGLEGIYRCVSPVTYTCGDCPYQDNRVECKRRALSDAIALLKEQEAKPMIENEEGWNCPSCGMELIEKTASGYPCGLIDLPADEPIHFCPKCGQAVKWE